MTEGVAPFLTFIVGPDEQGERLDKVVGRRAKTLGRRAISALFERGVVRADGRRALKGDRARSGSEISLGADATPIRGEPLAPIDVRLEAPRVIVARKPAGQPAVPLRFGEEGTFAAALLGRYPEMDGVGYRAREPGLIHRLDTQTSGLIVAARDADAFVRLRAALSRGDITKRYLAIVQDRALEDEGVIDTALEPHPEDPRLVRVVAAMASRGAPTRFRTGLRRNGWALVEIELNHAYRHQVRAHLAHAGHPIAGDALYGGPAVPALGARHALHASYVAWTGDDAVAGFAVTDPLPEDLGALLGE